MDANNTFVMLWIDLGYTKAEPVVASSLKDLYHVNVITTDDSINVSILRLASRILFISTMICPTRWDCVL